MGIIVPEKRPGIFTGILIFLTEKYLGKRMPLARILIWSPPLAVTTLRLELTIEWISRKIPHRLAKLVRIKVSLAANCPFCIDMNSLEYQAEGLSEDDIYSIRDNTEDQNENFTPEEKLVLAWIGELTRTPLEFSHDIKERLQEYYKPRDLVIMAALGAKVNFWARFTQSLGIPPAGLQENCPFIVKEDEE